MIIPKEVIMSVKIASFNMRDFSSNASRDMQVIAKIIIDHSFSIVAMQEVLDEIVIMDLVSILNHLGGSWRSSNEKPQQTNPRKEEQYAFLWNEEKVSLAKQETIVAGEVVSSEVAPCIIDSYRTEGGTTLARDPLYGRFWPKGEDHSEIRLINVHIKSPNYIIADRNREFIILAEQIYHSYCCKDIGTRSIYTIMLGDYNLNLNRQWVNSDYLWHEVYEINDNGSIQLIKTVQDKKTTFGKNSTDFANNFDHFSYDDKLEDVVIDVKAINTVKEYFNDKFDEHFDKISNHIPIEITIDAKGNR